MAFNTKSRATRGTTDKQEQQPKTDPKRPWAETPLDRNGNGRIDFDDLLIGAREVFQWVFSWRGAMVLCGGFTLFAGSINVASWATVTGSLAAGFLTWAVIQTLELMPAFDSFNMKSNIAALVRMQRKPLEIPVVNGELNPGAKTKFKRYRNRERNQETMFEAIRYICYGIELAVLVIGGGILSPVGISWSAVMLALVGIAGVELGLRMTNICGEKLLSSDEREFIKTIEKAVSRTTTTVSGETSKA